jgi:response regulator RpfG family c-di-GMP phosphodiesterase
MQSPLLTLSMTEKKKFLSVSGDSIMLFGIGLAIIYWLIDSFLNLFASTDTNFFSELLGTDVYNLYTRLIILCLFVIFGSHVQYTINKRKEAEKELLASNEKLQAARSATILGLAQLAEYRDKETGAHLERIREYAKVLAKELSRKDKFKGYITTDYIEDIFNSSILHDIGKVGIPDAILLKPGKLTAEEYHIIKNHTVLGGSALESIEARIKGQSFLTIGKEIAYYHHERWDGKGYPKGLHQEDIPLSARIISLADVYDALVSERVYKAAIPHEDVIEQIVVGKGSQFDPDIVDAFLARVDSFKEIHEQLQD